MRLLQSDEGTMASGMWSRSRLWHLDSVELLQRMEFCWVWGRGCYVTSWRQGWGAVLDIKEGEGRESSTGQVVTSLWLFSFRKSVNSSSRRMKRWSSPLGPWELRTSDGSLRSRWQRLRSKSLPIVQPRRPELSTGSGRARKRSPGLS